MSIGKTLLQVPATGVQAQAVPDYQLREGEGHKGRDLCQPCVCTPLQEKEIKGLLDGCPGQKRPRMPATTTLSSHCSQKFFYTSEKQSNCREKREKNDDFSLMLKLEKEGRQEYFCRHIVLEMAMFLRPVGAVILTTLLKKVTSMVAVMRWKSKLPCEVQMHLVCKFSMYIME